MSSTNIFPNYGSTLLKFLRQGGRMISVADYGVRGDDTDETTGIQAAADATPAGQALYFPPTGSVYKVTAPITKTTPIFVVGGSATTHSGSAQASTIAGNFSGYIFNFPMTGIVSGLGFSNLVIANSNAAGGGIYLTNTISPTVLRDILVAAFRAITIGIVDSPATGNFTVLVENCRATNNGYSAGGDGWGLYTGGQTQIVSFDASACDTGIRIGGGQVAIVGGRYETCKKGFDIGTREDGSQYTASAISASGFSMENNEIGVRVRAAGALSLSAFTIQGSAGILTSQYGVLVDSGFGVIQAGGAGGEFTKAAIKVKGSAFSFIRAGFGNDNPDGIIWDIENPELCTFLGTDYPGIGAAAGCAPNQITKSIGAFDQVRGLAQGKNLRGINLPVTATATNVAVGFPNLSAGQAVINTAAAVTDGASTLAPGTYYYVATLMNEVGETTYGIEKIAVVTSGKRVDITFFGFSSPPVWKRRVYRGTASGVYDGCFTLPLESGATFQDLGQAFTIPGKTPPFNGSPNAADGTEPDTNYSVAVTPSWLTTVKVTGKTTTGFTVTFGTAAPADATVDWHLIR